MEYKRKVFGYECDIYGHLNNANYLHYYEEARAESLEKMNLSVHRLNELGIQIYLTEIQLSFKQSLPMGEKVTIITKIDKASRATSVWKQEIIDSSGNVCNIAYVKGVFVKNGKPTRISKELYSLLIAFND